MKKSNEEAAEKITFKNLRRLYFFALLTIALIIIISQFLAQHNLNQQLSDSKIINFSGKQKMLSQKIVKEVLILHYVSDSATAKKTSHLKEVLELWKKNQNALENGSDSLAFPKEKSETLSKLYLEINPIFNKIAQTTDSFLLNLQQQKTASENLKLVQIILENEGIFLSKMNQIVTQYNLEAHQKVTEQRKIEYWIFGFTLLVLLLEFFFIFKATSFNITERKKMQREVERLNLENTTEKINQQKIISSKIVENQENEQNRIAKEIHDGIGQMLTGLKFSLESINLDDREKSEQKIEHLKKLSLDIIKGARTATFNLMPPELSGHGIVSSLSKLTQELSKLTGKEILFYNKTDFDQRLDSLIEINIYRLTQEAINNAIKYAESSHIIVQLSHSETLLTIIVDDNGKGFDINSVDKKRNSESGMGLLFMKERIQYINGRVFMNSIPGEGTRITFDIPILK
ncbi:type IV pili methyl-accepting chemotaxis transducer N-terminal domain-containing protein [Flavobacterium sp. TR2]|uniref:ATP-binding protein n=1 Tax=Flavobacterium sp. TR2 TaxID=2977321 RepID=UPI0021B0CFD9|nr:ATP-binding protein [Flavobacterium sp. TR2]UWY27882.1 type IV pili methyl-accepting chemotaxis transducer N-terminal domain-containing protein [Flavobacterium sp. TR2]